MTAPIVNQFLQTILETCFDGSQRDKKSIEKTLLPWRFNPVYFKIEHSELIKEPSLQQLQLTNSLNTYIGNIVERIVKTYQQEMQHNNIDTESILKTDKGRPKKGDSPWEKVYHWLWDHKFPSWVKEQYKCAGDNWFLEVLSKNANPDNDWVEFNTLPEGTRIAKGGNRRSHTIYTNQSYLMSLKLPYPNHHLLLLNRAEGEINLMCPSSDFAPISLLSQDAIAIPRENAKYVDIVFDSPKREEFFAIVVNTLPPKNEVNSDTLFQFWKESLEEQKNWQVFYKAFEVQNN